MNIRLASENDYKELAEMKWLHCEEDDAVYGEQNLKNCNKSEMAIKEIKMEH